MTPSGVFERFANRRDVWHGDELSGKGLSLCQWNQMLLSEIIAPVSFVGVSRSIEVQTGRLNDN